MPTVERILELAPTCSRLAEDHRFKKALFNAVPKSSKNQGTLIYIYWKILNTIYELDNDYPGLQAPANYLFELEQKWAFKAASIVDGGGSGQIAPITPSVKPEQLNFKVAASGTPLIDGQTSKTFSDFIGWNLMVDKNGQPMTQITTAPIYYTWNRDSGAFTLNLAAATGDEFQITPA